MTTLIENNYQSIMPCSECRLSGHNKNTCPQLAIQRAMSIINDGIDLAPYHNLYPDWFKDTNGKGPLEDLNWKFTWPYGLSERSRNKDVSNTLHLLYRLRWLIKDVPQNAVDTRTPITNYIHQRGAFWYSYTYDSERKVLVETPFIDELTGSLVTNDIGEERAKAIRIKIMYYNSCEVRLQQVAEMGERMNRILPAPIAAAGERNNVRQTNEEIINSRRIREIRAIEEYNKKVMTLIKPLPEAISCDDCPICLDTLGNTNVVILRCGHKTCGDCIFHHFQQTGGSSCPQCRQEFAVRIPGWVPANPVY
jgi:hypothetical protein